MRMQTTWGLPLIDEALDHPSTIRIDASDAELDGFSDDTSTEYRQRSVVRTDPGGSLTWDAPISGARYLGFVIYDSLDTETVEVWVEGARRAVATADANNRRERLLTLVEPYNFHGGEQIRLKTPLEGVGTYRIECIALFADLPPENEIRYGFDRVHAEPTSTLHPLSGSGETDNEPGADRGASVRLTWVTTWDAQCRVKYWAEGSGEPTMIDEGSPWANHRVVLTDLLPDTTYCYRLSALDPNARIVESETRTFTTSPSPSGIGSAALERIALTVGNPGDVPYRSVPVTGGIPFPTGVLGSSEHLRLLGPDGDEVPLQARTLGQWLDGSVKWALLDFQADVPPGSERTYTLEYGAEVSRARCHNQVAVSEDRHAVTVDTGCRKFLIDRSRFAPLAEAPRDKYLAYITGSRIAVTGADGKEYASTIASPESVVIEEPGPIRCVVRIEGRHLSGDGEALLRSVCRVHFYAGLPFVRLDHTLVNDGTSEEFTEIASMYLHIDTMSADHGESEVRQTHDDRSVIDGEAKPLRLGGTAGAGGVNVAIVDFWQQYPKSLRTHAEGIEIGLCPVISADDYRDSGEDGHKLYFYLSDGVYRLREGLSKTHAMYIGEDIPLLPLPIPEAPPEWYCESGAFGEIHPVKEGAFLDYETKVSEAFEAYLENREHGREYGMLNFGDWWGERKWNWGNCEYDTAYAFFVQWARSGDIRWMREGCRSALHHRDVDTCHASAEESRMGGVYMHCVGHTGDYYPDGFRPGAISSGSFTVSHTWVDGFLLHHFLTGDLRSLETARMVADRYDSHGTRSYDFGNCRDSGWHLVLAMAMYHATLDRFYLNASHIIVERVLERQTEDGGWRRMLVPGHCFCPPPRHTGNAGFMVGILLNGLKLYHQATGDPRVADAIVRGAEFLIDDMWEDDANGFRYTSCPHSRLSTDNFHRGIDGIAYAWRISRSPRFEPVLRRATQKAIDTESFGKASDEGSPLGKAISAGLRSSPYVLYDVAHLPD